MINIIVENNQGERRTLEIPGDMNLEPDGSMKAYEYNVLATCGGMAMCGTCTMCRYWKGIDNLPAHSNAELDMLDTLPDGENSRLACQLRGKACRMLYSDFVEEEMVTK